MKQNDKKKRKKNQTKKDSNIEKKRKKYLNYCFNKAHNPPKPKKEKQKTIVHAMRLK